MNPYRNERRRNRFVGCGQVIRITAAARGPAATLRALLNVPASKRSADHEQRVAQARANVAAALGLDAEKDF
jgi:hypothetical protein